MKKMLYISLIVAIGVVCSCSDSRKKEFKALDKAIEMRPEYDANFTELQDSLTLVMNSTSSDSLKWEAAYSLQKMLIYNNIDECLDLINIMYSIAGIDQKRSNISKRCYVNYLFRKGLIDTAYKVFEDIDTAEFSKDELNLYYDTGYRILNDLNPQLPEHLEKRTALMDSWRRSDSTYYKYIYFNGIENREKNSSLQVIRQLENCELQTLNDTAKVKDLIARLYKDNGDLINAQKYFAAAAECDMRLSAKTYNALYALASMLFQSDDIDRAVRYIRVTREDAIASNYESRYEKVLMIEVEITNILLKQEKEKQNAYIAIIITTVMMIAVGIILLISLHISSNKIKLSREKLSETSRIKDSFLAIYMERCVDYLNNVDKYRSFLRKTVKSEGADAIIPLLKQPSFADGEFKNILKDFDAAFLGIFPDFVEKVNSHMQPEYRLSIPSEGELSTELRILALIRIGITKRPKIAKVLNMSVNTVYSYHCNLHKHSLHPDSSFDEIISNL